MTLIIPTQKITFYKILVFYEKLNFGKKINLTFYGKSVHKLVMSKTDKESIKSS